MRNHLAFSALAQPEISIHRKFELKQAQLRFDGTRERGLRSGSWRAYCAFVGELCFFIFGILSELLLFDGCGVFAFDVLDGTGSISGRAMSSSGLLTISRSRAAYSLSAAPAAGGMNETRPWPLEGAEGAASHERNESTDSDCVRGDMARAKMDERKCSASLPGGVCACK